MGQNVDLRVLRAEEFASFRQRNIARYAQELLFARATDTEEHALTEAQGALDEMLPQGADTPRNYLLAGRVRRRDRGRALVRHDPEPETVFINDFSSIPPAAGTAGGKARLRAVEELGGRRSRLSRSSRTCITPTASRSRCSRPPASRRSAPPKGGNIFLRKRYLRSPFLV